MQQHVTLGNILPVIPLQVNDFLKKLQRCVWYQYYFSLAYHRLVAPFQFGTNERKTLKHPNMIDYKSW